jgi:hypothetical protein
LLIPGGIATFIGLHLYFIIRLGISEPPWAKRALRVQRDEEDARRKAARNRDAGLKGSVSFPPAVVTDGQEVSR